MFKRSLILTMMFLLAASVAAWAQRGGGGGGGSFGGGSGGDPGGGAGANPALHPTPKTPDEKTAAIAVGQLVKDPSATSDQMDKAIADFVTKYPKSDYIFQIERCGVQFYSEPNHTDVAKLVDYSQKALKIVSTDAYTLSTAGRTIVEYEKPDDPSLAENLKIADNDNKKTLEFVKNMPTQMGASGHSRGGGGSSASGVSDTDPDAAVAKAKQEKDNLAWIAYVSLGRSATMQKKYPDALIDFDKALPVSDFDADKADAVRSWVYLYTAQAQEGAGQSAAASASLDSAAKGAGSEAGLAKQIADEQAKVKAAAH